jgi:predicted phosphoribosyltransferase
MRFAHVNGMDTSFNPREIPFADRVEAGEELARHLRRYAGRAGVIVLGLPRGGVPVAATVASALGAPLDVFVVRKLGVPGHRELAMGAIASGGARVLNHDLIDRLGIAPVMVATVVSEEEKELARRERLYRRDRPPLRLAGQTVILVDDGLATGSTMLAAVMAVRELSPARVVVAVPVASADACRHLEQFADEVISARVPENMMAVGMWYLDFSPTTDAEVCRLLEPQTRARAAG